MERQELSSKDSPIGHICNFSLEETSPGYLSGAYVCKQCGKTTTRKQFSESLIPPPD
jgi:hypothetical protein